MGASSENGCLVITHLRFQECVGWPGGQGHQTNTATLIYCFTGQGSHCFDDYCARPPHYSDYYNKDATSNAGSNIRRLLIQTNSYILDSGFWASFGESHSFFVHLPCGVYYWSRIEQHSTEDHSALRAHTSTSNFFVVSAAICSQPPPSLVSARPAPPKTIVH